MKIIGNKLVARRNRDATLTFRLEYENGDPFVISSEWDNPYFVMTIVSSRYSQEHRYFKSWWISLVDEIRVKETNVQEVEGGVDDVPALDPTVTGEAYLRIVKTGTSFFWYSDGTQWVPYEAPQIVVTFTLQDTSEWIEQNYRWDCSILTGTLTDAGQGNPPLVDFVVVKSLVEDAEMEVSSDSMGGLR